MVQKRAPGGGRKPGSKNFVEDSKSVLSIATMQKQLETIGKSIAEQKKQNSKLKILLSESESRVKQMNLGNGFLLDLLYVLTEPKHAVKELDSSLWGEFDGEFLFEDDKMKLVADKKSSYIPPDLTAICQEIIDTKQIPVSLLDSTSYKKE